ncbi:MAG TPA: DUF3352 domain-containing protein [Thermoleophilaceae bacterium]
MTNTLRALAALCLVTLGLIVSGCGSSSGGSGSDPASVVPESSFLYAEATIDPSGSQESAMRSILADLPGSGAPQDRLENLIRDAISKDKTTKVNWDEDIKPWLGDKVAGFVAGNAASFASGGVPAAVVVATTDGDAARDALEKSKKADAAHRRYRDVEYIVETEDGDLTAEGVVDGFLVTGSDAGMKAAIDASKGGSTLNDSDKFKQATKDVPDERVGFGYADLGGLIALASQAAGDQFPGGALFGRLLAGKPLVITARAENQALIFEGTGGGALTKSAANAGSLLEQLPSGSWAALAIPGFGDVVRSAVSAFAGFAGGEERLNEQLRAAAGLDLDELLSWIGDVGAFADGDSKDTLGGGVLIKSKDPAASKRVLTKVAALFAKDDSHPRVSAAQIPGAFGYKVSDSDTPRGVFMVQKEDTVAITYGEDEAKAALGGGGLGGSTEYKRAADALGDGYSPALYVRVPPILGVADAFGASSDKDYVDAKPYLTILDYLIAGTEGDRGRLRIAFKPHD